METHAESHKPEVLETCSFEAAGAAACLCETRGKSQAAWGPAGPCHTGCKRIPKYTLIGSAVNASKFTNNCLVRCIKRFCAKKKAEYKQGKKMQLKVWDSCLLMPLYRMYCRAINLDGVFLRQRVVETYISML